ncbi:50S ribosomal protein L23 [Candidatus Johnevansia muelleri]|uniref:Large ribosomal subunit protein uL23 n=1 Tax=Candidatus Johnevansia muelleri TaxID=1495769 RepID=A0A078KHU3_9GAMM|nr:50S ribosomal protein L23 [Candidatus Evansia muelleri]
MKQEIIFKALLGTHLSTKTNDFIKYNKYVFKVNKNLSKYEIKKSVEILFKTKVKKLNVLNIHKKNRSRFHNNISKRYSKAYITLAQGKILQYYNI